jgi:ABC-type antimicrobial peptide transport system permease subunit
MQDASKFIMMGVVFSVAGLGVLNTMLMAVFERTRELGVLRALGLTPGQLLRLVLIESVLLTAVAGMFGLLLGGVLDYWVITEGLDFSTGDGKGLVYQGITLDPRIKGQFNLDGVVLTVAVMFSISVLAAVWPAVRAARLRPVDAMRHV